MATYFVGQRVRVVGAIASRNLIGRETQVTGPMTVGTWGIGTYQGYPTALTNVNGVTFIALPEWLEPIVPDGHRACDDDFKRDLDRLLERQGIAA